MAMVKEAVSPAYTNLRMPPQDLLVKIKDTEHQARIENRSERLKNIIGSFSVLNRLSM